MSEHTGEDIKGRVKEAVGDLTGNADLKHEGQIDQAVTYDINIRIAAQFVAGEIDGNVLFIDENAADKDHRRQIEQINQDEFAPDTQS